jgi:hypothetical protein
MVVLLFIGVLFSCQSKKRAMTIVCNAPEKCKDCKVEEIGPYLARRVYNRDVREMLSDLEDPQDLSTYIDSNNLKINSCSILDIFEEVEE